MIRKECIEQSKKHKASSAIVMICVPIFCVTLFLAVFWRLELVLLVMLSGGAASFALEYQYKQERNRPMTKEEEEELRQFLEELEKRDNELQEEADL